MKNALIQGKSKDWCSKCKNGTCYLKDSDSYVCTDPYDNEERAIGAQSDIECTMFESDSGRYPWGRCDTKIDVIYEDDKVRAIKVTGWGDEKGVPKGDIRIEELIKASKRKDDLIQNYRKKLKKANDEINLLNSKLDKLGEYYRTDEKLIDNIQKVIFPQEEGSDYTYSYDEILNKVKELKVQSDENDTMYDDLKYWKERCHKTETEVTTLNSKVEVLDKRNSNQSVIIGEKGKQFEELTRRYNMIAKKLNDIHDILKEDPNNE